MITMIVIIILLAYYGTQLFSHGFMACIQNFWVADATILWYLSLPFVKERFLPEITNIQKFLLFAAFVVFTWAVFKFFAIGAVGIIIFTTFMLGKDIHQEYGFGWPFWVSLVIILFLQGTALMNLKGELEEEKKAFKDEIDSIGP